MLLSHLALCCCHAGLLSHHLMSGTGLPELTLLHLLRSEEGAGQEETVLPETARAHKRLKLAGTPPGLLRRGSANMHAAGRRTDVAAITSAVGAAEHDEQDDEELGEGKRVDSVEAHVCN